MFTDEFTKRQAAVVVPGLPLVVVTPGPSVPPSVVIGIGGGDDEEKGHVLLHMVEMQFSRDSVASAVYLQ